LRPITDNIRDGTPRTGAVTDGTVIVGRFRVGAAGTDGSPAGSHRDAAAPSAPPAVAPRRERRSAQRGSAVTAVPEPSPPDRPLRPTRESLLTPAATPGTTAPPVPRTAANRRRRPHLPISVVGVQC
jgi:hypothetical protein